jgi:hypothetical protein
MDFNSAMSSLLESNVDITAIMRQALQTVADRHAALRLLLELNEPVRRDVFPLLVDAASAGHADIQWASMGARCHFVARSGLASRASSQ